HKILYVSGNNMQSCLIRGIGRKRDSHIVRSGLNIDDFLNAIGTGTEIRRKFGCADDDMIFATVARLFHLKGHKYILQAAPEIIRKHPGVKFMFIGDGILRERFERIAREEGISENIIFTGLIPPEEIPIYLDSCDGIIHPSLREGLPRVVPQAFLLEKPVIAFDVDGASEVVIPNITGFLIPPGDMINLKKSLNYVINNTEGAKKMALSGKKLILREFTIDKMVGDIEDIYKRMLIDG
ncbi:glycosyltransferase family 4 protein, partial [bacterium]|nr:glycosyltransferase family 4 protein [bacterium]